MASASPKLIQDPIAAFYKATTPQEAFDAAFREVLRIEGGYVNHPNDRGGATRYGITEATARQYGHKGSMLELTVGKAKEIYHKGYWRINNLDDIFLKSPAIALEMFEAGVNMAPVRPATWLQRLLNSMNTIRGNKYKYGEDLTIDGLIGWKTIERLGKMDKRQLKIIYNGLNALQSAHYITQAYLKSSQRDFFVGWSTNRIDFFPWDAETPLHHQ
jgi:lysozyme family protein